MSDCSDDVYELYDSDNMEGVEEFEVRFSPLLNAWYTKFTRRALRAACGELPKGLMEY